MNSSLQGLPHDLSRALLSPRQPLIPGVSDYSLSLALPIITHWFTAAVYECFEWFGIFEIYKIHTPEEEKTKNRISRLECLRGVILVQILQTGLGVIIGALSPTDHDEPAENDITIWTNRAYVMRQSILTLILSSGVKLNWVHSRNPSAPIISIPPAESIHQWDFFLAKLLCYFIAPVARFYLALWLADTWVFFIHRAEHRNQWLYKTFHARHHELYIPYSWAGIYDHPIESMFLSVGAYVIAVMGTGMSLRESMLFSVFSSAKAASDHSGYEIPGNPIDFFTSIGAQYHDVHHQRWGFKSNFALHFQFWDRFFGTEFIDNRNMVVSRSQKPEIVAKLSKPGINKVKEL